MSSMSSLLSLRPEVAELQAKLQVFVQDKVIPAEEEYAQHMKDRSGSDRWSIDAIPPCLIRLQNEAKKLGLWNIFIPPRLLPHLPISASPLAPPLGLTYREYGILCETMGRSVELAPQACNCSAPDTGNMEVFLEFGTPKQQQQYLIPLLKGEIRSTFLMTEPQVASSDPTNLETKLTKMVNSSGSIEYILTGRKWWSTGAMDPRCRVALVVAKMDYSHPSNRKQQQSQNINRGKHGAHTIVLVPLPHPNIQMIRPLTVFGYDDAPFGHAEVKLDNVRLTSEHLILGEGSGFRVSQARLGPGRIHHCMRAIGMAQRCFELMMQRSLERRTFGKYLWQHGGTQELIADSVSDLQAARLLTLSCAQAMDDVGPKQARDQIATIKVAVPEMTHRVVDRAIQVFGGAGVCDDTILARCLVGLRTLRIADGPDAVHKRTVALMQVKQMKAQLQESSRL